MTSTHSTSEESRMFQFAGQEISDRDVATFVIPVLGQLLRLREGEELLSYVKLSPRFEGFGLPHTPKLWIGDDGRMRLAYVNEAGAADMDDVHTVTGILRLDAWNMVILHTDEETLFVLAADEYASQV